MKNTLKVLVLFLLVEVSACNNSGETDSKKIADSTNTARIDSAKVKDTTGTTNSAMADQKQDAEFAVNAADGGMLEVALGKLAEKKGSSDVIKNLGRQMVTDHSKANMELKTLAAEKNISLPKDMSEKCQKKVSDLSEKNGKDFDKAYADLMVSDHKDDIDDFKKESAKGTDPQIASWAKGKVPVLEHHLMMAEDAKKNVD